MSKDGTYHCVSSCNKCGGDNRTFVTDSLEGHACEYDTHCIDCGFHDSWAYGFFSSGSEDGLDECEKYGPKRVLTKFEDIIKQEPTK